MQDQFLAPFLGLYGLLNPPRTGSFPIAFPFIRPMGTRNKEPGIPPPKKERHKSAAFSFGAVPATTLHYRLPEALHGRPGAPEARLRAAGGARLLGSETKTTGGTPKHIHRYWGRLRIHFLHFTSDSK